jgi:limonene-1,2-epoxide hydrolase
MPAALVSQFIDAIERNDLDHALTFLAEDCEYDNVPIGKVVGPEAVRSMLVPFLDRYQEVQWVVHHQTSSGDLTHGVVLNERSDRFRTGDTWVELPVAGVFVVRDSRIALWRDYFDRDTLMQLLAQPVPE